jgi:hypothetical protein
MRQEQPVFTHQLRFDNIVAPLDESLRFYSLEIPKNVEIK